MTALRIKQRGRDDLLVEVGVVSPLRIVFAGGSFEASLFD